MTPLARILANMKEQAPNNYKMLKEAVANGKLEKLYDMRRKAYPAPVCMDDSKAELPGIQFGPDK